MSTVDAAVRTTGAVGARANRLDGADKVSGRAVYTADVALPGMLIGRCLRSPHASARIASIDVTEAKALPGVHAVLTGSDVPDTRYGRVCLDISILAKGVVRFVGDKVAAVAAETSEIADEALALIEVAYEELPAAVSAAEAMRETAPRVHSEPIKTTAGHSLGPNTELRMYPPIPNVISQLLVNHGDAEQAFANAYRVFEHRFDVPSVHQGYIEPHSCLVAVGPSGEVDVWMSHKAPHAACQWLADVLGLSRERIKLNPVAIGGDFGGKGNLMDAPLCYYLARSAGRPVKMVMNYFEELTAANPRHSASIMLRTALDRDARILGMTGRMVFDSGAYAGFCPIPTLHGFLAFAGSYRVPNCSLEVLRVYTNKVPAGHMRAPGGTQITFAVESHLDMIAHSLQIDPYKFRHENAIADGDLSPVGERRRAIRCKATIEAAMSQCDWQRPKGAHSGRGMALYEYPPGTFDKSTVTLVLDADGKIAVVTGAPDTGTGFHTVLAQLAADRLGLPLAHVNVVQRDTSASGFERGASGSRLTTTSEQAISSAADKLKAALMEIAAERFACDASNVRSLPGGWYQAGDTRIDLKSLMAWAASVGKAPIVCGGENIARPSSDVTCFAAQIAEVDVDVETGQVKITRIVTAHDVGKVINPVTHQGQIEGGVIQGLGQTICEQLLFEDGAVVSATLGDYKLPTIADIPELVTVLVPGAGTDGDVGKAIGEMSNVAVTAAIANAVYDAVGVRLMDLPLTAEKVYNALRLRAQEQ